MSVLYLASDSTKGIFLLLLRDIANFIWKKAKKCTTSLINLTLFVVYKMQICRVRSNQNVLNPMDYCNVFTIHYVRYNRLIFAF